MTKTCRYEVAYFLALSFAVALGAKPSNAQGTPPSVGGSTTAPAATGKVVGPDSQPQAGVPIQVTGPEGQTTAFTDQHGNWSLYNLAPGTYQIKPAAGATTTTAQSQKTFTIEQTGLLGGLFGGSKNRTYYATEMKLDRNWASPTAHQD
jgi:hypothetical protein